MLPKLSWSVVDRHPLLAVSSRGHFRQAHAEYQCLERMRSGAPDDTIFQDHPFRPSVCAPAALEGGKTHLSCCGTFAAVIGKVAPSGRCKSKTNMAGEDLATGLPVSITAVLPPVSSSPLWYCTATLGPAVISKPLKAALH